MAPFAASLGNFWSDQRRSVSPQDMAGVAPMVPCRRVAVAPLAIANS